MWFSSPDIDDILATGVPAKCIGVGISTSPFGPFIVGRQPVICNPSGSIDPRTFVAPDGQLWLDWKADVNAAWGPAQDPDLPQNQPTVLWARKLAPDGMTLEESPDELLAATRPWEHKLIEAPQMVHANGRFYLFFSANPSYQDGDGIGVAVCRGRPVRAKSPMPARSWAQAPSASVLARNRSSPKAASPGCSSLRAAPALPPARGLTNRIRTARPLCVGLRRRHPRPSRAARAPPLFELSVTQRFRTF